MAVATFNSDLTLSNDDDSTQYSQGKLAFLFSKMSIRVLNVFMRHLPKLESEPRAEFIFVEGNTLGFARFDVCTAIAVACLCSDVTDEIVGL